MAKAPRLKVFRAEIDGLHDWIVAAPSRPKALEAFGVNQDLFAQGQACEVEDPAEAGQARAHPLVPLRRRKGSTDAFAPAADASDWSAALKATPQYMKGRRKTPKPKPNPAADKAREALQAAESEHHAALARLRRQRARIDEAEQAEDERYEAARAKARAGLDRALKS